MLKIHQFARSHQEPPIRGVYRIAPLKVKEGSGCHCTTPIGSPKSQEISEKAPTVDYSTMTITLIYINQYKYIVVN